MRALIAFARTPVAEQPLQAVQVFAEVGIGHETSITIPASGRDGNRTSEIGRSTSHRFSGVA